MNGFNQRKLYDEYYSLTVDRGTGPGQLTIEYHQHGPVLPSNAAHRPGENSGCDPAFLPVFTVHLIWHQTLILEKYSQVSNYLVPTLAGIFVNHSYLFHDCADFSGYLLPDT